MDHLFNVKTTFQRLLFFFLIFPLNAFGKYEMHYDMDFSPDSHYINKSAKECSGNSKHRYIEYQF